MEKKLNELLNYKPVVSTVSGGDSEIDSFLKNFNRIVGEVEKAVKGYKNLEGLIAQNRQVPNDARALPSGGVPPVRPMSAKGGNDNMPDNKSMVMAFLTSLQQNGYGEVPLQKIINDNPITVNQAISFIKEPTLLVQFLLTIIEPKENKVVEFSNVKKDKP